MNLTQTDGKIFQNGGKYVQMPCVVGPRHTGNLCQKFLDPVKRWIGLKLNLYVKPNTKWEKIPGEIKE